MSGTLNKDGLESSLYSAFEGMISEGLPSDVESSTKSAMEELARKMATAIHEYVKSGTVETSIDAVTSGGESVEGTGAGNIS